MLKKTFDMWSPGLVLKQVPPVRFKTFKLNESAGGVMGLIQQIINDAKAMAEAIKDEVDILKSNEDFVQDTNKSIE